MLCIDRNERSSGAILSVLGSFAVRDDSRLLSERLSFTLDNMVLPFLVNVLSPRDSPLSLAETAGEVRRASVRAGVHCTLRCAPGNCGFLPKALDVGTGILEWVDCSGMLIDMKT